MHQVRQPARHSPAYGETAGAIPNFKSADELRAHYSAVRQRLWRPKPPAVTPSAVETVEAALEAAIVSQPDEPDVPASIADRILTDDPPHAHSIVTLRGGTRVYGADIIEAVCKVTKVSKNELRSHRRFPRLVRSRFIVYLLCVRLTSASFVQIGMWVGDRDHSTVLHGINEGLRRMDELRDDIKDACALLEVPVPSFEGLRGQR